MTDLVYDYISMGVDMILTAAILSAIVVLLRSSTVLSAYQANLQANSDRMNYYKQFNMYDNTNTLCTADIISALLYYRYDMELVVKNSDGNVLITNKYGSNKITGQFYNASGTPLTVSQIQSMLMANWTYSSKLVEDLRSVPDANNYEGGMVTGLVFQRNP